jgi:hypothetical protein
MLQFADEKEKDILKTALDLLLTETQKREIILHKIKLFKIGGFGAVRHIHMVAVVAKIIAE